MTEPSEEIRALKGQLDAAYKALDIANEVIRELEGKLVEEKRETERIRAASKETLRKYNQLVSERQVRP